MNNSYIQVDIVCLIHLFIEVGENVMGIYQNHITSYTKNNGSSLIHADI